MLFFLTQTCTWLLQSIIKTTHTHPTPREYILTHCAIISSSPPTTQIKMVVDQIASGRVKKTNKNKKKRRVNF
jgi:hypothetical protein